MNYGLRQCAMEQHAIPQQISSYQFRLVGDMTLKQFFQLAGGALVSLLFYAAPLPGYVKWPFIIFFALLGVALAFLPFEERPLEKWLAAFFRAVYSPTGFIWQETKTPPVFFQEEAKIPDEKIISPGGEAALNAYLAKTNQKQGFIGKLEEAEGSFLAKLAQAFGAPPLAIPIQPVGSSLPQTKPAFAAGAAMSKPAADGGGVKIPHLEYIRVSPQTTSKIVVEEKPAESGRVVLERPLELSTAPTSEYRPGVAAQFSPEAAPPIPPTTPNTIVGQVTDSVGKIIESAILEIRDSADRPVRALRTNRVGHFVVVTPLASGEYQIITEKDGFNFDPVSFDAGGKIIPPIAIRARPSMVVEQSTINNQQSATNL